MLPRLLLGFKWYSNQGSLGINWGFNGVSLGALVEFKVLVGVYWEYSWGSMGLSRIRVAFRSFGNFRGSEFPY